MAYLTKKQFLEWAERVWKNNPRNLIKSANYCLLKCPYRRRSTNINEMCEYSMQSNHYDIQEYLSCRVFTDHTNLGLNLPQLFRDRAEFRQRYEAWERKQKEYAQQKEAVQPEKIVPPKKSVPQSSPRAHRSSSWEQKTFGYVTEEFNMNNRTAIDINNGRIIFVNGRMVSADDLRNNNS